MTFSTKKIDVTFLLGQGNYGESGFDTVKLTGLRCIADIAKAGGEFKGALNLRVFGMEQSMMNRLTKVGRLASSQQLNKVSIDAGDEIGMTNVFQGEINVAWADYQAMPDVAFDVQAMAGWWPSIKSVSPSSYSGAIDVATVMKELAGNIGATFENNGVSVILRDSYLPCTAFDQIVAIAAHAGIDFCIDQNVLAIWPRDGFRLGEGPLISKQTGMVGYPRFNDTGITLVTEFNPGIRPGGLVRVESDLKPACGTWIVNQISYNLASEMPGGAWFQTLDCSVIGRDVVKP